MADSVFEQLAAGLYDDKLDALAQAVRARRQYVSASTLTPGTKVVVSSGIKPKYLIGVTGTISPAQARRSGDLMVNIDEQYHARVARFGTHVGVPASCLSRVSG